MEFCIRSLGEIEWCHIPSTRQPTMANVFFLLECINFDMAKECMVMFGSNKKNSKKI
jgi:hypothetical protein